MGERGMIFKRKIPASLVERRGQLAELRDEPIELRLA